MEKIKLGISACLLGQKVRYDGGHKLDRYVRDTLGQFFEWVPVCPEVECGLSVPREAMHLEGTSDAPRLVTTRTGRDLTGQMQNWVSRRLRELEGEDLCGFIFKSKSPSSGAFRVKVYDENGMPSKVGAGMFAGPYMRAFPLLPVEEEGRLNDMGLRENFIERVFVYHRFRRQVASGRFALGSLVAFHTTHKLQILSHSQKIYRAMGPLVADGRRIVREQGAAALREQYAEMLNAALSARATPSKHTNVLQHIAGYFKKHLIADEKAELAERISQYRAGYIPLVVVTTLLAHYVRKYDVEYLAGQTYLVPHPLELKLRNHC